MKSTSRLSLDSPQSTPSKLPPALQRSLSKLKKAETELSEKDIRNLKPVFAGGQILEHANRLRMALIIASDAAIETLLTHLGPQDEAGHRIPPSIRVSAAKAILDKTVPSLKAVEHTDEESEVGKLLKGSKLADQISIVEQILSLLRQKREAQEEPIDVESKSATITFDEDGGRETPQTTS